MLEIRWRLLTQTTLQFKYVVWIRENAMPRNSFEKLPKCSETPPSLYSRLRGAAHTFDATVVDGGSLLWRHNGEVASQITSLTIVYSTVYTDADQRKHQSSASQAFVRGIHRGPVNSPHKWPVMRKMFPFDDVIMHSSVREHLVYSSLKQRWRFTVCFTYSGYGL